MHLIISDIKKDVKTELIKFDYKLFNKIFGKCYIAKLTAKELADPLFQEISTGNSALEEWITARWIAKNADVYQFFAERLSAINPHFEKIEAIDDERGSKIIEASVQKFGALKTCFFSVLNGVAFSPVLMEKLLSLAEHERS